MYFLKFFTWFADGLYIVASIFMVMGGMTIIVGLGAQLFTTLIGMPLAIAIATFLVLGAIIAACVGLYKEYCDQAEQQKNEAIRKTLPKAKSHNPSRFKDMSTWDVIKLAFFSNAKEADILEALAELRKRVAFLAALWALLRSCYSGFKNAHRIALMIPITLIGLGLISKFFLTFTLGQFTIPIIGCFILCTASFIEAYYSYKRTQLKRAVYKAKKAGTYLDKTINRELGRRIKEEKLKHNFSNMSHWERFRCILEVGVDGLDGFYLVASGLFLITLLGGVVLQAASMGVGVGIAFIILALTVSFIGGFFSFNKEVNAQFEQKKWDIRKESLEARLQGRNKAHKKAIANQIIKEAQEKTQNNQKPEFISRDTWLWLIKLGRWLRWIFCGLKNGHRNATSILVLLVAFGIIAVPSVLHLGAVGIAIPIALAVFQCAITLVSSVLKEIRESEIADIKRDCEILQEHLGDKGYLSNCHKVANVTDKDLATELRPLLEKHEDAPPNGLNKETLIRFSPKRSRKPGSPASPVSSSPVASLS